MIILGSVKLSFFLFFSQGQICALSRLIDLLQRVYERQTPWTTVPQGPTVRPGGLELWHQSCPSNLDSKPLQAQRSDRVTTIVSRIPWVMQKRPMR